MLRCAQLLLYCYFRLGGSRRRAAISSRPRASQINEPWYCTATLNSKQKERESVDLQATISFIQKKKEERKRKSVEKRFSWRGVLVKGCRKLTNSSRTLLPQSQLITSDKRLFNDVTHRKTGVRLPYNRPL